MRDHDDLPYIVIERRGAGLGPFLWGALLGAGAALLLAPRAGAETQEEIRERVRRARRAAEDRVDAVRGTVDRTRGRIEDQITTVRSQFESRADQARSGIDTARRAARDARAGFERRVSDVRETVTGLGASDGHRASAAASEIVVTDVAEERTEGRADLG